MFKKNWTAAKADVSPQTPSELVAMSESFTMRDDVSRLERGILSIVGLHALSNPVEARTAPAMSAEPIAAAPAMPPSTSAEAPKSGNPLASFAAKKPAMTDTPIAAAPAQPVDENRIPLDEDTRNILADAAENARREIFKNEKVEDAAE